MSLNFPTAFWKKQPESTATVTEVIDITWETALFWSQGGGVTEENINNPIQMQSTFPFVVKVDGENEEYYTSYTSSTYAGAGNEYYGWYLTGGYDQAGENDLSSFHRANPWIPYSSGIALWNEADYETSIQVDSNNTQQTYNHFVQSGSATGTFSVSAAQASQGDPPTGVSLYTTVSGLGEDYLIVDPYNIMHLYLDSTKIADGVAPQDDRNVTDMTTVNYDQQQTRLYAGSDTNHVTLLNPSSVPWLHIVVDPVGITNTSFDYIDNTYINVSLGGGSGTGIKATVVVYANEVESVTITNVGSNYQKGDILSIPIATIGGTTDPTCEIRILGAPRTGVTIIVLEADINNPSTNHNNGTYYGIYLAGGSGAGGIRATVVVFGGVVTSVTITDNSVGYKWGDILTIPKGTTGGSESSTCAIEVDGFVNQLTRDVGYTTEDGTYTFKNAAISEGTHQIKIYASTMDGWFSSGSFYGFKFWLS